MIKTWLAFAISGLALVADIGTARAAQIKLFSPAAMKGVMPEVIAQFERSTSHKVIIEYGTVGALADRLLKGEAADVVILSAARYEDLEKQAKITTASRADVARVGIGLFVRAGAPKPDIGSVDAFKRTLLAAKSVSYGDPAAGGVSGVHMAGVLERLGITADVKARTKLFPNSQAVLEAVAKGEAEIGIGLASDTAFLVAVDLAGALPADLQSFTLYAAGISASSMQPDPTKSLITFLSSPAAHAVLKAKGFEPR